MRSMTPCTPSMIITLAVHVRCELQVVQLCAQVRSKGERLRSKLREALGHNPHVKEVRGLGLICGVQLDVVRSGEPSLTLTLTLPLTRTLSLTLFSTLTLLHDSWPRPRVTVEVHDF